MSQSHADQLAATALSGGNAGFIEDLYEKFLQDPASVDPAWAKYFGDLAGASTREAAQLVIDVQRARGLANKLSRQPRG